MRPHTLFRALTALSLSLVALAPAAPALARRRPAPVVEAPPPPPPPAAPVGLPQKMIEDAAAYQAYMLRVATTAPGFDSAQTVSSALHAGAHYQSKALVRGAIAYAAIAALEDHSFIDSLRNAGNTPENRRLMVRYIETNPIYLSQFAGADAAAGYARAAIAGSALHLQQTGRLVRQSAYDVQHQDWSKVSILDPAGRLKEVESLGVEGIEPGPEQVPILQKAASLAAPLDLQGLPLAGPMSPMVARAVQVAAIAALGEAPDETYESLSAITVDALTTECLERAKRDLYQCLAVSKPNYEDIFCMGRHEMLDPAACLAQAVAVDLPPEPPPPPMPVPVRTTRVRSGPRHHVAG
ncbi:MAG TPA: hypothetical protein VG248_11815 [Caulobacteraceae bacterium]|jgi:hypothetical protein|nr:hypothetical protein [Caulobacteraceae bacterium]